jgi:hypothetical protein
MHLDYIVPGACASEYDILRSITAVDQCGNTAVANQNIHVGNSEGPVIEGIDTAICDDLSMPLVTAFDECEGVFVDVSMTQDTVDGTCQGGIVIRRTWIAEDECGHISEVEQFIVIGDTTAPVINIPHNSIILQFIDQDTIPLVHLSNTTWMNEINALDAHSVSVVDDCEEILVPLFTESIVLSDSVHLDGFTEQRHYSWIAADACGNADTIEFTINLFDDMPPVVGLPGDLVIVCCSFTCTGYYDPDRFVPTSSVSNLLETIVPGIIRGNSS